MIRLHRKKTLNFPTPDRSEAQGTTPDLTPTVATRGTAYFSAEVSRAIFSFGLILFLLASV